MRRVEPKVHLVAETIMLDEVNDYLTSIGGAPSQGGVFDVEEENDVSAVEALPEFMGRLCYRSWKPELNKNVTKVRDGNDVYLRNVLSVKHGSVLEHSQVSFVFQDVSRVFTHELVRHRVGVGISQESLRFVRLDDLGMWLPSCITDDESLMDCPECKIHPDDSPSCCSLCGWKSHDKRGSITSTELFEGVFRHLESLQLHLAKHFKLDDPGVPFAKKKEITSAMRRIAPIGLATTIGWSANIRTLRFVLALRTHRSAEQEIRLVFDKVGLIAVERWRNLFLDFKREEVDGIGEWTSENWKV